MAIAARNEIVVRALLDDSTALEKQDSIGSADRREAMRDDDDQPAVISGQIGHRLHDVCLGRCIQRRGWFVEDQHVGVSQHPRAIDRRCFWPTESAPPP